MTEIPIASPEISEAAKEAVRDVLDSGMLADGEVVRAFESEFADYVGVDHAVATSSGTTALHAMLEAAGIGEGDVVLTTPFSFVASATAVRHTGAEVAFADVHRDTFNLDPDAVRNVLDDRDDVTALLPVHLYGLPADMDAFRSLAAEYDLLLFEDAAQAHGATYDGEMAGSIGDAGAFSFYPTKNMTTGEGGMITTDDADLADRARQVVNHGRTDTYEHEFVGYNFRMTNVHAAIGREQLKRLPGWVEERRENARILTRELEHSAVELQRTPPDRTHAYHQFSVRTSRQDVLKSILESDDIGYGIYYPKSIPEQPAYDRDVQYPVASRLTDRIISVPIHPHVRTNDLKRIEAALKKATEVANGS